MQMISYVNYIFINVEILISPKMYEQILKFYLNIYLAELWSFLGLNSIEPLKKVKINTLDVKVHETLCIGF